MNTDLPLCSIVIRAYNEEKHIGKLLSGIQMQDYPAREIILVDSGSSDKTSKAEDSSELGPQKADIRLRHPTSDQYSDLDAT